jgi:superoxide dismutase
MIAYWSVVNWKEVAQQFEHPEGTAESETAD